MDERDALRQQIRDRLKRVPAWVGSASVQATRDFQKTHTAALKMVEKANTTLTALQGLRNQINTLYDRC